VVVGVGVKGDEEMLFTGFRVSVLEDEKRFQKLGTLQYEPTWHY
jgi:hypothetical protein